MQNRNIHMQEDVVSEEKTIWNKSPKDKTIRAKPYAHTDRFFDETKAV